MTSRPADAHRRSLTRTVRLLKAFRTEQTDPDAFYDLLAADAVASLAAHARIAGSTVLDVGGGAGYLTAAFRGAGANSFVIEPSLDELSWRGARPLDAVIGDGARLPVRAGAADIVVCSNVLEHARAPYELAGELIRVARPGGLVWISFTNWYSPWGGHETSPWHYRGGEFAAERYRRRNGRDPKNRFGETLFPVHVGDALRWAYGRADADVLEAGPRYHPAWARAVVRVPGVREVVTWNLEILLRRRSPVQVVG